MHSNDHSGTDGDEGSLRPDSRLPAQGEMRRLYRAGRHSVRRALGAPTVKGKLRVEMEMFR